MRDLRGEPGLNSHERALPRRTAGSGQSERVRLATSTETTTAGAPWWLLGAGVAATVAASTPLVPLAFRQPGIHLLIDTTVGLVALLAAFLLHGRAKVSHSEFDWWLTISLGVAGVANLALAAVPAALSPADGQFATWAPAAARLVVAGGLCAASFSHPRARREDVSGRLAVAVVMAVVAAVAAVVAVAATHLPVPVDPSIDPSRSSRPFLAGHPLSFAVQAADMALYLVATIRFRRIGARTGDPLIGWLAVSTALAALARFDYMLFPSLYTQWVYVGDAIRLTSFLVLLMGAAREIERLRAHQTLSAIAEERRRLARDIHDGLAQELAFLRAEAQRLVDGTATADPSHLASAAQRALDESRLAIETLTTKPAADLDLVELLRTSVEDVAHRHGVVATCSLTADPRYHRDVAVEIVRIAREAVANACRHGAAQHVEVRLDDDGPMRRLVVSDDGTGFDVSARHAGFGLRSMAERAEGLGGTFVVRSSPEGTTVEVTLP